MTSPALTCWEYRQCRSRAGLPRVWEEYTTRARYPTLGTPPLCTPPPPCTVTCTSVRHLHVTAGAGVTEWAEESWVILVLEAWEGAGILDYSSLGSSGKSRNPGYSSPGSSGRSRNPGYSTSNSRTWDNPGIPKFLLKSGIKRVRFRHLLTLLLE